MTLDDILLIVDRATERMTSSGGGETEEWDALVQYLAPAILGSPTLLREAVQRAWSSGLTWQPYIVTQVQSWLERPLELDDDDQRVLERIRRMRAARTAAVQDGLGAADQAVAARIADLEEIDPAPGWEERAVQAWRRRQAERAALDEEPAAVPRSSIEHVPEHLRAAHEWMDGGSDDWHALTGAELERFAYDQQEAAQEQGRTVPAESIIALAAWLRSEAR